MVLLPTPEGPLTISRPVPTRRLGRAIAGGSGMPAAGGVVQLNSASRAALPIAETAQAAVVGDAVSLHDRFAFTLPVPGIERGTAERP